ncbi:response regulator [Phytohabitans suffuscus]|nr:response regulator transcription factor [Phytohabitans suffuscus]
MVRIAVVDDHPIARHGLSGLLEPMPDLEVVASVGGPDALPREPDGTLAVDLVILDLYLDGERPALDTIRALSEQRPVLVISASREPADVVAAMQSGASGYVTKHAERDAYRSAIQAVADGEFYLSSQLADLIQAAVDGGQVARDRPVLAPREQEALSYIARGFTHRQTATRMGVSTATVNTYVARIRAKLQLGNKAELALAALRYVEPRRPAQG